MRIYAYRISDNVPTISTVTWDTFTGTLEPYESYADVTLTPSWVSWDVKEMVSWAYANDSPLYIALDGGQFGVANTNREFVSRESVTGEASAGGLRPYISITYTNLVAPPGPSISAPGKLRVSKMRGTFK